MKQISKPNEVNNIVSLKKGDDINLVVKGDPINIISSFYFSDFSNTKAVKKFIKNIEMQIRRSEEYKHYIGHLDNEIGIHRCSIFGNITDEDQVTLEFHHYPFTLYDIIEIVINRRVMNNEEFCSMDIINEVLDLHRQNKVGLTKLCKTAHELVHDGKVFVKLESVFGKVDQFIEDYKESIPDETIDKYNKLIEMNDIDFQEYILDVKNRVSLDLEDLSEEDTKKALLEVFNDEN